MRIRLNAVLAAELIFAVAAVAGDAPDVSGLEVTLSNGQTMPLAEYRAKLIAETNNFVETVLDDPETAQNRLNPKADMENPPNNGLVRHYAWEMRSAMSAAFDEQVKDMESSEEIDGVREMLADPEFGVADVRMFFMMMGEEAAVKLFETIIAQDAYDMLLP